MISVGAVNKRCEREEETEGSEYGYEDHVPSPRHSLEDDRVKDGHPGPALLGASVPSLEGTDVSYSPSATATTADEDYAVAESYCSMPADRLARKQRSFHRRGGELHANLLKSAVMASMDDCDDDEEDCTFRSGGHQTRHMSRHSSISLQSLHEALEKEGVSPRKRARRRQSDQNITAVVSKLDLLKVTNDPVGQRKSPGVVAVRPEPPVRRVSRRTSYESHASTVESDVSFDAHED